MTRLDHRSGPSRGIVFALLAAGLTLLVAAPASAKKKSPPPSSSSDSAAGADNEVPKDASDAKPASQANDTEKPHTILDTTQEAPKTDSLGHVHFASPNGEGLGRVVVNAPVTDKVKVFLEGRLFGTAPLTIYSVPKGDYIVEAQYPNGKEASKPVTVSENEETVVDLGGAKTAKTDGGGGDNGSAFSSEMTSFRKNLMYGFLAGTVVGIAVGATFGILDIQAENDWSRRARRWAIRRCWTPSPSAVSGTPTSPTSVGWWEPSAWSGPPSARSRWSSAAAARRPRPLRRGRPRPSCSRPWPAPA